MASAGTVTLELDANSVKLMQELQKAQNRSKGAANNMAASFSRAFGNIAKSAAAIGVALAGAMAAATKSSINAADALSKQAQATGIAIEELSALKYAADLSGVAFESMTASMGKLNRGIVDAYKGTGTANDAFRALGINVKNADGSIKNSSTVLGELADRFAGMEDGAVKSALAMDIFGRSGAQMIPLLNQGSAGIKGMTAEAERLGLVIDQKTGAAAEAFNDALRKLQLSFTGLGNKLMQDALPHLTKFTELINDPATQQGLVTLVQGLANFATQLTRIAALVPSVTKFLAESLAAKVYGAAFDDLPRLEDQLKSVQEKIRKMQQYHRGSDVMQSRDADRFIELLKEQERLMEGIATYKGKAAETPLTIGVSRGAMDPEELLPPGDDPMEKFRLSAQKAFDATRSGLERAVADFAEFQIAVDTLGSEAIEGMGVNVEQVFDRLRDNVRKSMDGMKDDTDKVAGEMDQYMIQAARNMQSAFADFLFDPFQNGLKGMLKGLLDTVRQMVAQIMAFMVLKQLAGLGGPIGSFFSMGLPSRDSGGRGTPGQPYLIGQKAQPEIFIPDSAGTFIPNADELGGGSNFNITIDARDPGAEGRIRTMIQEEMAPQIIEAATGRTMSMLRRPRFA
jgi:hypothetical protein